MYWIAFDEAYDINIPVHAINILVSILLGTRSNCLLLDQFCNHCGTLIVHWIFGFGKIHLINIPLFAFFFDFLVFRNTISPKSWCLISRNFLNGSSSLTVSTVIAVEELGISLAAGSVISSWKKTHINWINRQFAKATPHNSYSSSAYTA